MSGHSGAALGASVLVSSPVFFMLQQGALDFQEAVERWAICLAVCWLTITVIGTFMFPDPGTRPQVARDQDEPERAPVDAP